MPSRSKSSSATAFKPLLTTRPVRYAPYGLKEGENASLTANERSFLQSEWMRFRLRQYTDARYLLDDVAYMVPYNGNGQGGPTLESLTGKKRFDFFAYTFVMPGKNEEWSILWDYETGLVRTAGIFKPLGHIKSAPKIALESSAGLLQIAANVNGGRVDLQGYWVPFKAAFELSTKFAYELRAVLYPIFGPSILRSCVPLSRTGSINFAISPDTVHECKRDLQQLSRSLLSAASGSAQSIPVATTTPTSRLKRKAENSDDDTVDITDDVTRSCHGPAPESGDPTCMSSSSPLVSPPISSRYGTETVRAGGSKRLRFEDLKDTRPEDIRVALWLTEMARAENITAVDDAEVLKQALGLTEGNEQWLQEVIGHPWGRDLYRHRGRCRHEGS